MVTKTRKTLEWTLVIGGFLTAMTGGCSAVFNANEVNNISYGDPKVMKIIDSPVRCTSIEPALKSKIDRFDNYNQNGLYSAWLMAVGAASLAGGIYLGCNNAERDNQTLLRFR